jgi:hypothetical protein
LLLASECMCCGVGMCSPSFLWGWNVILCTCHMHMAAFLSLLRISCFPVLIVVSLKTFNFLFQTALHCAALKGHLEVCRLLLSSGASIDIQVRWSTPSILHDTETATRLYCTAPMLLLFALEQTVLFNSYGITSCAVLYTVLCLNCMYTKSNYTMLSNRTIPYHTMPCHTIPYHATSYNRITKTIVSCTTIKSSGLHPTLLYDTDLHFMMVYVYYSIIVYYSAMPYLYYTSALVHYTILIATKQGYLSLCGNCFWYCVYICVCVCLCVCLCMCVPMF